MSYRNMVHWERAGVAIAMLLVFWATACSSVPYTWAADIPAERAKPSAARRDIQPGDVVEIEVVGQPALSGQRAVGVEGTVALPNVGPVRIAGFSSESAEVELVKSLSTILSEPRVSLVVVSRSIEVTLMGEIRAPGKIRLNSGDGVASAVAMAGGLTEFGNENAIFLIRSNEPVRIRFRLHDLLRGGNSARSFALRDKDLLVIE